MHPAITIFYFIPLLPLAFPTPLNNLHRRGGSAYLPFCFYNQGCPGAAPTCHGSPLPTNCQEAINATCSSLVETYFTAGTTWGARIGTNEATDCIATANLNGSPIPLDMTTCLQRFSTLQGCFESTNVGFSLDCMGGSINVLFCLGPWEAFTVVSNDAVTYQLGSPAQLNLTGMPARVPGSGQADIVNGILGAMTFALKVAKQMRG